MQKLAALVCLAACTCVLLSSASARWKEQYASIPPEERAWYERQQTTPETRERLQASWYMICCDHSDTVNAKFSKRGDRWQYQQEGTSEWRDIPQDIVQPDVMTPHGKSVLFVDATGRISDRCVSSRAARGRELRLRMGR
jgi:hypothetical protein